MEVGTGAKSEALTTIVVAMLAVGKVLVDERGCPEGSGCPKSIGFPLTKRFLTENPLVSAILLCTGSGLLGAEASWPPNVR